MRTFLYTIASPIVETITIIAFLALVLGAVWLFLEKTQAGARIKAMTPWMGWDFDEQEDERYTNFVIHPSNYIKVPRSR